MERIPQTSIDMNENPATSEAEPRRVSRLIQYENYQSTWMENMRGSLILVATVIATMNFTIAINPPGGVWQQDTDNQQGCTGQICKAGTAVLGHSTEKLSISLRFLAIFISFSALYYDVFLCLCTISFSASLSIILLLICGFPLTNRIVMWMLIIAMCISVYFTAAAYIVSVSMVMKQLSPAVSRIIVCYAVYWAGMFALVFLLLTLRLLCWLMKKLLVTIRCLCCCLDKVKVSNLRRFKGSSK